MSAGCSVNRAGVHARLPRRLAFRELRAVADLDDQAASGVLGADLLIDRSRAKLARRRRDRATTHQKRMRTVH
jgi:hypothetical protein